MPAAEKNKPAAASNGDTTATTKAQGRFVVSLPASVGDQVDSLMAAISATVEQTTGVAVELTRPQVIQSVVQAAYNEQQRKAAASAAVENGGGDAADTPQG